MRTELSGREPELAALTGCLAAATAGHPQLALCEGEPGIGKTRLAAELVALAAAEGALGAWGLAADQATFVDEDRAAEFWLTAAALMEHLATAPGFIRRFNFVDGPHYTLIALWRTPADAHAFFSSDHHQTAMRELFRRRWQYSHFAGLWEMITPRQRVIFCQQCDGVTPATDLSCVCGTELFDPFATPSQSRVDC